MGIINWELVEELPKKREEAGFYQSEIAAVLGKDQPYISRLERGYRKPTIADTLAYAFILNFDLGTVNHYLRGFGFKKLSEEEYADKIEALQTQATKRKLSISLDRIEHFTLDRKRLEVVFLEYE